MISFGDFKVGDRVKINTCKSLIEYLGLNSYYFNNIKLDTYKNNHKEMCIKEIIDNKSWYWLPQSKNRDILFKVSGIDFVYFPEEMLIKL